MFRQISYRIRLPRNSRDLLHAANLRHGTDGFTSPPKEDVLRIFLPLKIRRLRPGLNPRTWVPKASTLPLDHRSRYVIWYMKKKIFCIYNMKLEYCGRVTQICVFNTVKCSDKFRIEFDFHVILEIFYMPQIYDMGQTALLPLRRKTCWGFFCP